MILRILEGLCKRMAASTASIYRLESPEWFNEREGRITAPPFFTSQEIDMSLNSFITLGRSGLRVSPFCLGSMTFGEDWGWGASVADSEAMIAGYLERGGNFIDTATSIPTAILRRSSATSSQRRETAIAS
jgi:hypothetical protein